MADSRQASGSNIGEVLAGLVDDVAELKVEVANMYSQRWQQVASNFETTSANILELHKQFQDGMTAIVKRIDDLDARISNIEKSR